MLIIQSLFPNTLISNKEYHGLAKQAMLSCRFLKRHGFRVILYTSSNLRDKLFANSKYDEVLCLKQDLYATAIVDNFWSGTKLLACSLTKEPYLHVDTDIFFIENVLSEFISERFITFHKEPWMDRIYFDGSPKSNIIRSQFELPESVKTYNCAVFGGNEYEFINSCASSVLHEVRTNRDALNLALKLPENEPYWRRSVFLEQIYFSNMVAAGLGLQPKQVLDLEESLGIHGVCKAMRTKGVVHLWFFKDALDSFVGSEIFADMMEKYYF